MGILIIRALLLGGLYSGPGVLGNSLLVVVNNLYHGPHGPKPDLG